MPNPTHLMVSWNCSATKHEKLKYYLDQAGLGDFCPSPYSELESLEEALKDRGRAWLVANKNEAIEGKLSVKVESHRSKKNDGMQLTAVHHRRGPNEHQHIYTARLSNGIPRITAANSDQINEADESVDLQVAFFTYRKMCSSSTMGQALVDIVRKLNGARIHPTGRVYFLPPESEEDWGRVKAAFEGANEGNVIHRARLMHDDDSVAMILSGVASELESEASALKDQLSKGSPSEETLSKRTNTALELLQRAQYYEGILGAKLTTTRKVIRDAIESTAATTSLKEEQDIFQFSE